MVADATEPPPFLKRVRIKNYRSIGDCDVTLRPLTLLVGRNGAGKSNFLDAIRFVSDALTTSVDHAVKSRGVELVRRRVAGDPRNIAVELELLVSREATATYGFEIGWRRNGGVEVRRESLSVRDVNGRTASEYRVHSGTVESTTDGPLPPVVADRLYLVVASGLLGFRPTYDALTSTGFYNFDLDAMRDLQLPDAGELLRRDGGNIAGVVKRLSVASPSEKERLEAYLSRITPGVVGVDHVVLGPRESILFRQEVGDKEWRFFPDSMSDGTLRSLGFLAAVAQPDGEVGRVRLVGIEEPENGLHPAAAHALLDALTEASEHTQVIVTTHSADLLSAMCPSTDGLLAVEWQGGQTYVAPVDGASLNAISEHLYDAGELLRMDQLEPDRNDLDRQSRTGLFADDASP